MGKLVYSKAQIFSLVRHFGMGCGLHIYVDLLKKIRLKILSRFS